MSLDDNVGARQLSTDGREKAKLLDEMTGLFAESPYVSHIFTADGYEEGGDFDPDLVVAFDIEALPAAVETLDTLMGQTFTLLFPGTFDKGPDGASGIGAAYLILANGRLFQVKVLLTTSGEVLRLPCVRHAKLSFNNPAGKKGWHRSEVETSARIADLISVNCGLENLFIEVFQAATTVQSAIDRRALFLNHAATHRLTIALRNLMRAALDPEQLSSGWAGFARSLSFSQLGSAHLAAYEAVLSGPAVHTQITLLSAIRFAINFMKDADNAILERLEGPISFYTRSIARKADGSRRATV
jgi:hypothetical protein